MDQDADSEKINPGEVTTLKDYLSITACLFGSFFLSMLLVLCLLATAKVLYVGIGCFLASDCDLDEILPEDVQSFVFALTAGGIAVVLSLLALPLCFIGGVFSLRFRLSPGMTRPVFVGIGFICAALYGALLYFFFGHYAGEYKAILCGLAVPLSGALACYGVFPMLRKMHIPDVFTD